LNRGTSHVLRTKPRFIWLDSILTVIAPKPVIDNKKLYKYVTGTSVRSQRGRSVAKTPPKEKLPSRNPTQVVYQACTSKGWATKGIKSNLGIRPTGIILVRLQPLSLETNLWALSPTEIVKFLLFVASSPFID